MSDCILKPDDDRPPARQLSLVAGAVPDLADVPASRRTRDHPSALGPCEACGAPVLTGRTASGKRLALDAGVPTFVVLWENNVPMPQFSASRA